MIPPRLVKAVNCFPEKFGEAWLPWMLAMTQGDLGVVSWGHVVTAYDTGIKTAISFAVCCLIFKRVSKYREVVITGLLTFIADLSTHPSHFGSAWTEALVTGLGASLIVLLVEKFRSRIALDK